MPRRSEFRGIIALVGLFQVPHFIIQIIQAPTFPNLTLSIIVLKSPSCRRNRFFPQYSWETNPLSAQRRIDIVADKVIGYNYPSTFLFVILIWVVGQRFDEPKIVIHPMRCHR